MATPVGEEMTHTVAVRHYLHHWLVDLVGEDVINQTIVGFLPPAAVVDTWTKEQHRRRNISFLVIFGVISCVGILLLEGLRLCMNCFIKRQKMQRSVPEDDGTEGGHQSDSIDSKMVSPRISGKNDQIALLADQESFHKEDGDIENEYYVSEDLGEEDDPEAEDQAEATRKSVAGYDPQDLFFVAWQHIYAFNCLAVASYAFANDYLSEENGLDFELYIPWLIGTILFHTICLIFCFFRALDRNMPLPCMLGIIPKSTFNPAESHLGTLRDAVSAGIYARHSFIQDTKVWGPIWLSAMATICMFLPNLWIYCDLYPFRDFQEGLWPVVIATDRALGQPSIDRAKADRKSTAAASEESYFEWGSRLGLGMLDAATREHKQAVAWLGEIPQAIAGIIFLGYYVKAKDSLFILVVTFLNAVKSALVVFFRPHILCALASFGLPWIHLTRTDVNRAIDCTGCTWICRSKACRGMLKDVHTAPRVRIAAIDALKRLYDANSKPSNGCSTPTSEEIGKELGCIRHAILWEVAMHSDRQTQLAAMRVMKSIQEDEQWAKVAWQLQRLRSDDPDEKKQALVQLAENYPQYAGAYISDVCRLLAARTPSMASATIGRVESHSSFSGFKDQDSAGCCSCFQRPAQKHTSVGAHSIEVAEQQEKWATAKAYQQTRDVREAASRALGLLGKSLQDRKVDERVQADVSEAMGKKAPEVVSLLGSANREVRSAALSAVYQFRGEAAVIAAKFAIGLLEQPGKHPGKRKVGEIALVELLPVLPPDDKTKLITKTVELLNGDAIAPRNAAYRVLCRVGGRIAREVLEELERQGQGTTSTPSSKEMLELNEVLRFQENAVQEMGGNAAAAAGLNLVLHRRDDSVKLAQDLIKQLRGGAEVFEALSSRGLAKKIPPASDSGKTLLVFFTDLEPDDVMFMAQMWKYLREKDTSCCTPLVIFSAELDGKDGGEIFEKKILLTALMMGQVDLKVLTPAPDFPQGTLPKERHPLADKMENLRDANIKSIAEQVKSFKGTEVKFYICAPGRGNLAALVQDLSPSGSLTPSGATSADITSAPRTVNMYSGQFNIKGMSDLDLNALCLLVGDKGVLVDAAKFPFFGGNQAHGLTKSFTTFAIPSFAPLLSCRHPLIAAFWGLMNDEFNKKLIAPEKLFEESYMGHVHEKRITTLYKEGKIKEYAQLIAGDPHLFGKVVPKKKVTLRAFACDCCDAPLCDQLLFLNVWLKDNQPQAAGDGPNAEEFSQTWIRSEEGAWNFNKKWQYTSVDTKPGVPGLRAIQPVMRQAHDVEALYLMSEVLQKYTLGHLEDLSQQMNEGEVRRSKVFSASR